MPTIRQITLPDGVTYDLAATAINREVVPIVTEYSGSETTFNALEVTEDSLGRTFYNINSPAGNPIFQWVWDGASELQFLNGSISVGGTLMPYGGESFSNGGQYFENATALPAQTAAASYNVLCVDSFANGGRTKYCIATPYSIANTIVTRQENGFIYGVYYNSSNGAENIASFTSYVAFVDSDGWHRKTSLANFKNWFGAATYATLNYLGSTEGKTAKSFTVNSNATEFVICAVYSNKVMHGCIPRNLCLTSAREVWLTGGKNNSSIANQGALRALVNVTLSGATLTVTGVSSNNEAKDITASTSWYVYQR